MEFRKMVMITLYARQQKGMTPSITNWAFSFFGDTSSTQAQVVLVIKNPPANAGDKRSRFDPWVGKIPAGGHGNPLQYSYLENPMDRGACRVTVMGLQIVRHDWSDLALFKLSAWVSFYCFKTKSHEMWWFKTAISFLMTLWFGLSAMKSPPRGWRWAWL